MTPIFRIALFPLLLMLFVLPGCGSESDADATPPPGPAAVEFEFELTPVPQPTNETEPTPIGEQPTTATTTDPMPPEDPIAPSAYVVIQNAAATDPQLLVRQLQQVLHNTQVVKQIQSPDPREIKLEVTNIKDVRALANLIPFGSVESVDDRTRTITIDFDL